MGVPRIDGYSWVSPYMCSAYLYLLLRFRQQK